MPELLEFNVKAKRKPTAVAAQQAADLTGGIQLQTGKCYVTRGGQITKPMEASLHGGYALCYNPETNTTQSWYWDGAGKFGGMQHDNTFCMHIVKEFTEPTATVPDAAPANFLPLQVGKKYKCRNGNVIEMKKMSEMWDDQIIGYYDGVPRRYAAANGLRNAYKNQPDNGWHIVGLAEEPAPAYVSGQTITKAEADKIFKEVQIQYQDGVSQKWWSFPKNHYKIPSDYLFPAWRIA